MNNWIIFIPLIVAAGGLGVSIWNARHTVIKDDFEKKTKEDEKKTSETDNLISLLRQTVDLHEREIANLKDGRSDLETRMRACELARDDLAKRNLELEREKVQLLTQFVTAGVVAQIKK